MAKSSYNPKGHLQIYKVFPDHSKELVWDESNTITSGMGVGLSHLFSASGSQHIEGFQILNFAIGTSGNLNDYGASTFSLSAPLTTSQYGPNPGMNLESYYPIENGSISTTQVTFGRIKYNNIHRVNKTAVRFTIVLDQETCNTVEKLSEIGLFMRNPRGVDPPSPILVAYRPFIPLTKTRDYSLIFVWTIQF